MREILFRGFHKDENGKQKVFVNGEWINGEWVEGNYIYLHKTTYCFEGDTEHDKENEIHQIVFEQMTDWDLPNKHLKVNVIPETVGQYTGWKDKNGAKIFEGDVLQRKHKEIINHSQNMEVKFVPEKACFAAVDIGGGNVTFISDYINYKYEIEIIGNIHDNPELWDGVGNG